MSDTQVIIFGFSILGAFVLLLIGSWYAHWLFNLPPALCPYTRTPLRSCKDLSYFNRERILRFLFFRRQYDNRIFDLNKAAFSRDTGRIFPDCVTWYDAVKVDWSFLQKRYPGHWVSWGSLTERQQEAIIASHHKLEGYQMEFSSPDPSPSNIRKEYAYSVPGPLYVDLETKVLLGWKIIPDTDFEVLIVTKPKGIFETPKR